MTPYIQRLINYMARVVQDGGPSVVRWVYLRTSEATTLGWITLVIVGCVGYLRRGVFDPSLATLIGALATAIIAASGLNQNTKIAVDAPKSDPSTITTPAVTITTGNTEKHDDNGS